LETATGPQFPPLARGDVLRREDHIESVQVGEEFPSVLAGRFDDPSETDRGGFEKVTVWGDESPCVELAGSVTGVDAEFESTEFSPSLFDPDRHGSSFLVHEFEVDVEHV
jgi:hypothetical protein